MSTLPTPFDVRLQSASPQLEALLNAEKDSEPLYEAAQVTVSTELVPMRDGARLATEVYMPPVASGPGTAHAYSVRAQAVRGGLDRLRAAGLDPGRTGLPRDRRQRA